MTETALSHNGILIRLPDERWQPIIQRHTVLTDKKQLVLNTLSNPTRILEGNDGALLAIQQFEPARWLVVAYREEGDDEFVITAFPTRRINFLNRRRQIW
ncbi:hypothetical protein [Myxacorys almedinensis]|uniref:Uncharacterized protein n=1 Tax=Myxacorys almedinensis A TaxID=2690445 RepID=A0A8J8CGV2_9CYAN|nr:hypothetical protein [Myxacorys almedinensis]NDJ15979.1 hypothetical protein [Myxacorys almedinensis A]